MKLILVAGMHRSGTSFVTELLHAMGAYIGDGLLEPAADNPHGFWERRDVKQLNDELLQRLDGAWDRPPRALTPVWPDSAGLDKLRQSAEELISGLFHEAGDAEACAIKDPRFSLTGPFWTSVVSADASVIPLRDPLEVALSLRHRDGMAPSRAAALWIRYTLSAILELPNPRLVSLHDLTTDPDEAVPALARQVGLEAGIEAACEVARGRGRSWQPDPALTPDLDDADVTLARSLFSLLTSDVRLDAIRPALAALADQWRAVPFLGIEQLRLIDPDDVLGGALDAAAERLTVLERELESGRLSADDLRRERDQARRELRTTTQRLSNQEERVREIGDRLKAAEAHVRELESRVADRSQQLQTEEQRRATAEQRVREMESLVADRNQQLQTEEQKRIRAERRSEDLRAEVQRVEQQRDRNARRARASERQFERLKSRRSVQAALRIAAPFRPIIRLGRRARRARSARIGAAKAGKQSDGGGGRARPSPASTSANASTTTPAPVTEGGADASSRAWSPIIDRLSSAPPVTVIVPVFNAPTEVERCLSSLVEWTPTNHEILVIDDASTDPAIPDVLAAFEDQPNVRIAHNEENLGFTRTVNRGFDDTSGDVVILNSDARVTPNWLTNLRVAAYSGDRIASASAVSDNAGAFSLPEPGQNDSPGLDEASLARLYLRDSKRRWPQAPTGHGFCMYVRRQALAEVGGFDAERFPRGYGEENDWSMRAREAGWTHVIDDATMVFHTNAASFDPATKTELVAAARARVDERHPDYTALVRSFLTGDMQPVRADAREIDSHARDLAQRPTPHASAVRPRLLSVVQAGRGGTPNTNRDLMISMEHDWDPWILTSDGRRLRLHHVVDGVPRFVEGIDADEALGSNRPSDPAYREFVARIVVSMGFELIHVRHLFKHAQHDLPDLLRALALPAVLSFHDYYWICPNVNLVDENGNYCGGHCTPSLGDCDHPVPGAPLPVPLKHHWVHEWRRTSRTVFDSFDQFVTTSASAAELMQEHYPELHVLGFNVIPHGRDLENGDRVATEPDPAQIRIAVIGNLSAPKGGRFLRELLACDTSEVLDVHIVGTSDPEFLDLRCTFHGRYERDRLGELLTSIRPSFGALLSIWPETWSHTLTEAWSVGLPVLVSQHGGALRERVLRHGGGWIIDTDDPRQALEQIVAISEHTQSWRQEAERATVDDHSSIAEMADEYRGVYALARRRRSLDHPIVDVRVVTDAAGRSPGSAHVRSLRRFTHPDVRRAMVARTDHTARAHTIKSGPANVIWVQRTAVASDDVDELLRERERRDARLVVDLDDDLVHADGLPRQFSRYVPTMRRLLGEADLVTVSTGPLVDVVAPWATRVEVLPNQLDENLWMLDGSGRPERKLANDDVDILYMGTETHADDLELIREPFQEFTRRHRGAVRMWVVGGAPRREHEWFHRIAIPDDSKEYPAFVPWLRSLAARFDFAVAPLGDTPFNRSKSDLKFLEYAGLGLPAILSDCPAYRGSVTHDVNGFLTENDADAWVAALETLASRADQERIRSAALAYVETRTIGATASTFVELVRNLR